MVASSRFPSTLLLHRFAEFHPGLDPRPGRLLVHAFRQAGHPNAADEYAVERKRYSAADEVNLPRIHVHDAEVSIGPSLVQLPQRLRGLPVKSRSKRLAL